MSAKLILLSLEYVTQWRFTHQVMRIETSVRSAEDLDRGALTYAEIKAIASGNPAVEQGKIDTEIRKLDQLPRGTLKTGHRWTPENRPTR
jgi:hypothetical protein